jgi:hypothetical protein
MRRDAYGEGVINETRTDVTADVGVQRGSHLQVTEMLVVVSIVSTTDKH